MSERLPDHEIKRLEGERDRMLRRKLRPSEQKNLARIQEILETQKAIRAKAQLVTAESIPALQETKETKVQKLIERIEEGFSHFEQLVRERVEQLGGFPVPHLREEQLYAPFQLVELNKENPIRNREHLRRNADRHVDSSGMLRSQNINFFFYDTMSGNEMYVGGKNMCAGFSPVDRTMHLSEHFDMKNIFNLLVLYHELRHVAQDTVLRSNVHTKEQFDAYVAFHSGRMGQRPRIIVTDELTAYAYELEILNILLLDRLRSQRIDAHSAAMQLQMDDMRDLEMLIDFSRYYYPNGMSEGTFPPSFIHLIESNYSREGYELYVPTTTGQLKKLN